MPNPSVAYRSSIRLAPGQPRVAAVYCSDGRFGEAIDDFLTNGLGLPNYDRLALPGGPARLARGGGAVDDLRFLVEAHALRRVVLIQHAGCGYYAERLKILSTDEEAAQRADLARAARVVRESTAVLAVSAHLARPTPTGIAFDPIDLSPDRQPQQRD